MKKHPIEDYLSNKRPIQSAKLKNKLIKEGIFKRECQHCKECKLFDIDIPLELHHIDKNHDNNNLTNLMIVCPNCHEYLHYKDRQNNKKVKIKIIIENKKRFSKPRPESRKVKRPTLKNLLLEIESSSYLAVGKKYGVSDNAIRKWIKTYKKHGEH